MNAIFDHGDFLSGDFSDQCLSNETHFEYDYNTPSMHPNVIIGNVAGSAVGLLIGTYFWINNAALFKK